jgi:hypothetical protein
MNEEEEEEIRPGEIFYFFFLYSSELSVPRLGS